MKNVLLPLAFSLGTLGWACSSTDDEDELPPIEVDSGSRVAPPLANLGGHSHPVSTQSEEAQNFFDQGLTLHYAQLSGEAGRAFRQAVALDPDLALGYWGQALVLGPRIDSEMDSRNGPQARAFVDVALGLAEEKEHDLLVALSARYGTVVDGRVVEERSALDQSYADSMGDLLDAYPDDVDILVLRAESLMLLHPGDYWEVGGAAQPWTDAILAVLERALLQSPEHPGANYLYIRVLEGSRNPERALASAERLESLATAAAPLVRAPARIYLRTGRYRDAMLANGRAIEAQESYEAQCRGSGFKPLLTLPSSQHALYAAASFAGHHETALAAALSTVAGAKRSIRPTPGQGIRQHLSVLPLFAQVRFGRWDEILEEPLPSRSRVHAAAVSSFARGMAFLGNNRLQLAQEQLQTLAELGTRRELERLMLGNGNSARDWASIARRVLEAEISSRRGLAVHAEDLLREAVVIEEGLAYSYPPVWPIPVRQNLGAVLLEADRAAEAEAVFLEDLERFPENGWSLYGLYLALEAQRRDEEAALVLERFEAAWQQADIRLESARIL